MYINEICKMLLFSKAFSVSISYSVQNHPCYPNKEKNHKLFFYSYNVIPVIDPYERINTI